MSAKEMRTLGFDDAPFTRADGRVPVVGVHMRGATRVEGIFATDVLRDGDNATNRIARCVADAGLRGLHALLLDGASFGGFNVVDLDGLREETGVPCLAFTVGTPDFAAMDRALANVPGPEGKRALLARRKTIAVPTPTTPLTISFSGMDRAQALDVLAVTTLHGLVPEPLRLAHMIARVMR